MPDVLIWISLALLLIMTLVSLALATFGLSFLVGAPFVATPKIAAREMLKFADLQPGETLIDLGSGDGSILFVAADEFGAGKAVGYEINPILVFIANWKSKWRRNRRVLTIQANFFSRPMDRADVVSTYLWPSTMDRLLKKLKNELSPETRIISRGFEFHGVKPLKIQESPSGRLYLYQVEDL